tara:strand:- start:93 stop:329 length:237 start_codon:yes stop_codon:yes gene_type:complete
MKRKVLNTDKTKLRNLIKEVITEQQWVEDNVEGTPVSFTDEDRMMLKMIYDVVVMGGAAGGYGGVRRRPLAALGTIPD